MEMLGEGRSEGEKEGEKDVRIEGSVGCGEDMGVKEMKERS